LTSPEGRCTARPIALARAEERYTAVEVSGPREHVRLRHKIDGMGKPPLKRPYFDTNAAYRWPNPSDQFWQMLNLSGHVKTELYFPATVEAELEAQFLRRVDALAKSLRSSYREDGGNHK
jgi:hypothetical protein